MLDGGAADAAALQRLSGALAHRAADDVSIWSDGAIGLVARLWHTTPESRQTRQPYHTSASGLSVVLDGRIDNRDDLQAALRGHADLAAAAADVELVAAAYERWGADCAAHLVGDFVFAVWDARAQRLCCSRDVMGLRPLFFRADARRLAWASEPHALLRFDGTTPSANERMVGEYLTFIIDKTETLLDGVNRLAPAHTLVADRGGVRTWQYWDVDPDREIRYADDRDYVEHLRALLADAVRAQTRSAAPVGVMLSGGLDSSTVLAMAQPLRPAGHPVTAYSIAADGPQDETAYFREAAALAGARSVVTRADLLAPLPLVEEVTRYLDLPDYPNAAAARPLHEQARADGVRVMLTGLGADEWLQGSLHHYADQLRRGQLVALARGIRQDARSDAFPGWRRAARMALWPLLSHGAQQRVRRMLRRPAFPRWVGAAFGQRIGLGPRLSRPVPDPGFPTAAQYDLYREGMSGSGAHAAEMMDRQCSAIGIETRHPYYDRRILEFAMAIPDSVRWRDGQPKHVLRQVAAPIIPAAARRRLTSPDYSPVFVRALELHGGASLFRSLRIAEQGWVEQAHVAGMYDEMMRQRAAGNSRHTSTLWSLWMIFVVDLWFRTVIAGAPAARPDRPTV